MNTYEAEAILKREGFIVNHNYNRTEFYLKYPKFNNLNVEKISPRKLIRMARRYTSEDKRNTKFKSNLKEEDRRKNRAATKRAIAHEKWDDIPQKGKVKEGDPRNWN